MISAAQSPSANFRFCPPLFHVLCLSRNERLFQIPPEIDDNSAATNKVEADGTWQSMGNEYGHVSGSNAFAPDET